MKKKEINEESDYLENGLITIRLINLKMFKDLSLDFSDGKIYSPIRWINLVGNNGTGKTTLLRYIGFSLMQLPYEIFSENSNFFEANNEGTIFIDSNYKGKLINSSFSLLNVPLSYSSSTSEFKFNVVGIGFNKILPETRGLNPPKHKSYYSIQGLFDNQTNYSGIEQWTVEKFYKEKAKAKNGPLTSKGVVDFINGITKDFGIQIDKIDPEGYFIYKESDQDLKTWQISDGLQSVIYIVGNILYHLAQTNKDVAKPWELPSVILIDEIDSHLHPQWRRIIPGILQEAFPNAQFIVTTHSPVLVQNSGVNAVTYLLKKQKDGSVYPKKIEDAAAMDIERLMESPAFGLESTYSIAVEEANEKQNQIAYGEDVKLTKSEVELIRKARNRGNLNPELEAEILKFLKKHG